MKPKKPKPLYIQASEAMGAEGGRNGRGEAKSRNSRHYRVTLSEARAKAKLKRQLEKLG